MKKGVTLSLNLLIGVTLGILLAILLFSVLTKFSGFLFNKEQPCLDSQSKNSLDSLVTLINDAGIYAEQESHIILSKDSCVLVGFSKSSSTGDIGIPKDIFESFSQNSESSFLCICEFDAINKECTNNKYCREIKNINSVEIQNENLNIIIGDKENFLKEFYFMKQDNFLFIFSSKDIPSLESMLLVKDNTVVQTSNDQTTQQPKLKIEVKGSGSADVVNRMNQYDNWIQDYSKKYDVPSNMVKAMISWESSGRPEAISFTGCVGLGQFCYGTAKGDTYAGIFEKVTSCNCGPGKQSCKNYHACNSENDGRFDPQKSIEATSKYLADSYKNYDGNIYLISISYNAGPGVANTIKQNLGDKPATYENIRPLLNEAVLKYFKDNTKKIKEVDSHMNGVAGYYSLYEGNIA